MRAYALVVLALVACQKPDAAPAPMPAPSPVATASSAAPKWPYAPTATPTSDQGMVVTDEAKATRVGRDVLTKGGNAVDAAVAIAFTLAVTFPTAGNIGGGGFAVLRHGADVKALDFRETAPAAATRDMYLGKDGKPTEDSHSGIRSVGVPGSVAGLHEMHQKYGKLPWAELLAPAIAYAKDGFDVDDAFLDTLGKAQKTLAKHPVSAATFLPGGQPPAKGSKFVNAPLAVVLARIAKEGPKGFYQGPTAAGLVAQMKADGGLITPADLGAYRAKWREPITFTYRGKKVVSMPPPSSGGITMALMAHILDGYDLKAKGFQSPETLHFTFEAMRRAFAARNMRLGDPDFVKMPVESMLSETWAKDQRATIDPVRATPSSTIPSGAASGNGPHTTHFSVVDAQGDAVALTTTVNHWFGSGVTVKDGGYVLNNEMDDFASVPGEANGFGLVQGEANAIAPGKRMLSSMSPTLVFDEAGAVQLVLGAAGGPTIITAVFQELSNVLDFGLAIDAAVDAPRFHMQHLPDQVSFEHDGLAPSTADALKAAGYELKEREHLADAPGIGRRGATWLGVAEPRRLGALAAGP